MSLFCKCKKCGNAQPKIRVVPGSVDIDRNYYLHQVRCEKCGNEGPEYRNAAEATKHWNIENWQPKAEV